MLINHHRIKKEPYRKELLYIPQPVQWQKLQPIVVLTNKWNSCTFLQKMVPIWKIPWYVLEKQPPKLLSDLRWNPTTKSNLRRKGFVSAHSWQWSSLMKGKSEQELKVEAGYGNWSRDRGEIVVCSVACSACCFIHPGDVHTGGTNDSGLGLHHSVIKKMLLHRCVHRPILWRHFLSGEEGRGISSSQITCVQLKTERNK